MSEECVCGFEAKNGAGLSAHQRSCDEYQAQEDEESDTADAATVSTTTDEGDDNTPEEYAAVFERDEYSCRRCGETESLDVHRVNKSSKEEPSNLVVLCEECDKELTGVDWRTKRDVIR